MVGVFDVEIQKIGKAIGKAPSLNPSSLTLNSGVDFRRIDPVLL